MVRAFIAAGKFKILWRNEAGVTLIEVLVALAILGIVGVGFLSGTSTTFRATMVSQERVVAENLAKSQLEHIETQDYIPKADYDPGDPDMRYELIDIPANLIGKGYDVEINTPQLIISPGETGFELQSLTVVIKRDGEEILTISGYKVGKLT